MTLGLSGSIRNKLEVMVELVPSMMPRLTLTLVMVRMRSFFRCTRSSSACAVAARLRSETSTLTLRSEVSEPSPTCAALTCAALKDPWKDPCSIFSLNHMNFLQDFVMCVS